MNFRYLILIIIIISFNNLNSLTFKSDGTVINSDGSYLKLPPFQLYQEALSNYLKGEPISEDWPIVKKDANGQPLKVKGYFGEKILQEGAPLFSIPKSIDEDVMKSLALQNGLMKDQFGAILVSTSNQEWRDNAKINDETFEQAKNYSEYLSETNYMAYKLNEMSSTYIELKETSEFEQTYMQQNPNDSIAKNHFEKIKSSKINDLKNKLNSYFNLDSDESLTLISKLDDSLLELNNSILNRSEIKDILQLDLKNNLELISDQFVDDMNFSNDKVSDIIENKTFDSDVNIEDKLPDLVGNIGNLTSFNYVKYNLDKYQSFFKAEGVDSNFKLSDEFIQAQKYFEEYPGAAMEKFNALASVIGNASDFNKLSKAFKEDVERVLKMQDGTIEGGLKKIKWEELNKEFQQMTEKEFAGQDFDKELRDQIESEMIEIERDLNFGNGATINEMCSSGKMDPDDC